MIEYTTFKFVNFLFRLRMNTVQHTQLSGHERNFPLFRWDLCKGAANGTALIVEQPRERGNPLSRLNLRTAVDENVLQKVLVSPDQNVAATRTHLPVEELPNKVYSDNQLKSRQDKGPPHK